MPLPILPNGTIEFTTEFLVETRSGSSNIIYLSVIVFLISATISLPFISVPISITGNGLLRPVSEVSMVRSTSNGKINALLIRENLRVKKGQVLFILESVGLMEREQSLLFKIEKNKSFIMDLILLKSLFPGVQTATYRQSLLTYTYAAAEAQTRLDKARQDFDRTKKLFDQQVIAKAELEGAQFEFDKATDLIDLTKQNQLNQWQSELRDFENETNSLQFQLRQLEREKENLIIKSPVTGTIQGLSGLYSGSAVFINQDLAQISPDTSLLAEVFISPNDIGLIHEAMTARFKIDAFNYNQWGMLSGHVKEISDDIQIIKDQPVFEVKCLIEKEYLQLKNGYKGKLKKGMTLEAHFVVTRRSLWELLYDKVDDWVNPQSMAITED